MASGNFISSTGTNLNLYVTWSSTTNVSTNASSVTAKVYMRSYTISGSALADSYITINGNKKSFAGKSLSVSTSSLKDTLLVEHTVSVAHNSDGKKSITIKANLEFNGTVSGKYLSDITASKTVDLDTIPRASGLSVATSVNTGSSLTATITPANSAFTHKISYIIGNTTMFTSDTIAAGTTTYVRTIDHSWLPKLNSANMVVRLLTFNGSTQIGITDKTVSISVPSSIVPIVSSLTATVVNGLGGYYVEGKSQVKLTATATAGSGSTLSSYVFSGANISGNASTLTSTNAAVTSSTIQQDGTVTYSVVAKDGRPDRQSAQKTTSITVYPYSNPQITSITAQRCLADGTLNSDGTYARVTVKTSYSSVNGANKRVLTLYSSKDNYATGTVVLASTNTGNVFDGVYSSGFSTTSTYTIRAVITDSYNSGTTIQKSTTLKVAERAINVAKYGNGVAIGGLSTVTSSTANGLFECNWGAKFTDNVNITGAETVGGNLTVTGSTTSGSIVSNGNTKTASLTVTGAETVGGNLTVTGSTTSGSIVSNGNTKTATLTTTGNATIGGDLTITGKLIASDMTYKLDTNGYQKLPSGLIIVWGSHTMTQTASQSVSSTITFPITFPNKIVYASGQNETRAFHRVEVFPNSSRSGATIYLSVASGGNLASSTQSSCRYFVIGY